MGSELRRSCWLLIGIGCGWLSTPSVTRSNCTRWTRAGVRRPGMQSRLRRSSRFREPSSHTSAPPCTLGQTQPGEVLWLPRWQRVAASTAHKRREEGNFLKRLSYGIDKGYCRTPFSKGPTESGHSIAGAPVCNKLAEEGQAT